MPNAFYCITGFKKRSFRKIYHDLLSLTQFFYIIAFFSFCLSLHNPNSKQTFRLILVRWDKKLE